MKRKRRPDTSSDPPPKRRRLDVEPRSTRKAKKAKSRLHTHSHSAVAVLPFDLTLHPALRLSSTSDHFPRHVIDSLAQQDGFAIQSSADAFSQRLRALLSYYQYPSDAFLSLSATSSQQANASICFRHFQESFVFLYHMFRTGAVPFFYLLTPSLSAFFGPRPTSACCYVSTKRHALRLLRLVRSRHPLRSIGGLGEEEDDFSNPSSMPNLLLFESSLLVATFFDLLLHGDDNQDSLTTPLLGPIQRRRLVSPLGFLHGTYEIVRVGRVSSRPSTTTTTKKKKQRRQRRQRQLAPSTPTLHRIQLTGSIILPHVLPGLLHLFQTYRPLITNITLDININSTSSNSLSTTSCFNFAQRERRRRVVGTGGSSPPLHATPRTDHLTDFEGLRTQLFSANIEEENENENEENEERSISDLSGASSIEDGVGGLGLGLGLEWMREGVFEGIREGWIQEDSKFESLRRVSKREDIEGFRVRLFV